MVTADDAVLGVDGCPGGWIGALVRGRSVQWLTLPDAAAILAVDTAVVGIDIPIGAPEPGDGYRLADIAARGFLRPWAASNAVFFTPVRQVLGADSYEEANVLSRQLTGKGLPKQTWNITDRIAGVDDALGPQPDERVVEVHPEVSFRLLDPSIDSSKKSARGVGQRISALSSFVDVSEALAEIPAGPGLDDCLDACVAAWSARRWLTGQARVFGLDSEGRTPTDARGRPMRIVA